MFTTVPRTLFSLVPAFALTMFVASPAPASPTPDGSESTGARIVSYAEPDPSARHLELQGVRVGDDGCEFSLSGVRGASDPSRWTRYSEISYDPSRCTSIIELTNPRQAARDETPTEDREASGGTKSATRSAAPGTRSESTSQAAPLCENPYRDTTHTYTRDACIHSWFEDPPGIHVNDLTNEVQWNASGGCAHAGWSAASYYAQWLGATGWRMLENSFMPSFSCSGVTSHNETIFSNTTFCAGVFAVFTGYNQKITGLGSGGYSWNVRWAKNGVCSGLLSFHTEQNP